MANKMLIDTTHPEETRVVVLRGNRVEEFDFESANRRQLRGNIYLAKVTRVEPSLQAAFVDYGGNRHGFLAFSEIHPDYYQIPVADRQALIAEEERAHRDAEDEIDRRASGGGGRGRRPRREHSRRDPVRTQPLENAEGEQRGDGNHVTAETSADDPDTHQADVGGGESGGGAPHEFEALEHEHEAHEAAAAGETATPTETVSEASVDYHEEVPAAAAPEEQRHETIPATLEASPTTESPELAPEGAGSGRKR